MGENVLVVGNGSREHALVWALGHGANIGEIYCAPGNPGTAELAQNLSINVDDHEGILQAVHDHHIDLVVVGPEAPLAAGLADKLRAAGCLVFGPNADAARIESSKAWAKEILNAAGAPTARAEIVTNLEDAERVIAASSGPVVVKADGLAAGKGVIICPSKEEARQAALEILEEHVFGDAGSQLLIEEWLEGMEVSLLVVTDGQTAIPLLPACDYKRAGDGDTGLNTGGMGAYAPPAVFDAAMVDLTMREVIEPVLSELRTRGHDYKGVLYAGLMLTDEGPKVLEFNCRFGDPETQVVLPMLQSDFLDLCLAVARGDLASLPELRWHPGACVGIVLASGGYPGVYKTGLPIEGLHNLPDDVLVFHAGTAERDGAVVTAGGRVLTVVTRGEDMAAARDRSYEAVRHISFQNSHLRTDIAAREIELAR